MRNIFFPQNPQIESADLAENCRQCKPKEITQIKCSYLRNLLRRNKFQSTSIRDICGKFLPADLGDYLHILLEKNSHHRRLRLNKGRAEKCCCS